MQVINKIFGSLKVTWKYLLPFAVLIGVYTGLVLSVPAFKNTSIQDIGIGYEWWILFAMVIISNSEKPMESAIKDFYFLFDKPTNSIFGTAERN